MPYYRPSTLQNSRKISESKFIIFITTELPHDKGLVPIHRVMVKSAFTFSKHSKKTLSVTIYTSETKTVRTSLPLLVMLQSLKRPHPKIALNCIPRSCDIALELRHVQPPQCTNHADQISCMKSQGSLNKLTLASCETIATDVYDRSGPSLFKLTTLY